MYKKIKHGRLGILDGRDKRKGYEDSHLDGITFFAIRERKIWHRDKNTPTLAIVVLN